MLKLCFQNYIKYNSLRVQSLSQQYITVTQHLVISPFILCSLSRTTQLHCLFQQADLQRVGCSGDWTDRHCGVIHQQLEHTEQAVLFTGRDNPFVQNNAEIRYSALWFNQHNVAAPSAGRRQWLHSALAPRHLCIGLELKKKIIQK